MINKNPRKTGEYDKIWTSTNKCVFCDLNPNYVIYAINNLNLTINLYPYCDGHLLIVPNKHIASPKELSKKDWEDVRKLLYIAKKIIKKRFSTSNIWTLIREGGLNSQMSVTGHLHIHCIPFYDRDFVQWNYKDLSVEPKTLAKELKSDIKFIDSLSERFNKKYDK